MFIHSASLWGAAMRERRVPRMAALFIAAYCRAESVVSNTLLMICKLSPGDITEHKNCSTCLLFYAHR